MLSELVVGDLGYNLPFLHTWLRQKEDDGSDPRVVFGSKDDRYIAYTALGGRHVEQHTIRA